MLDELIAKLRAASMDELRSLVAENMPKMGPTFYLRIAALSDQTQDAEEKVKLASFSSLIMKTMQEMYEEASKAQEKEGNNVQELLKLCAEDDGEFMVPLSEEKVIVVRQRIAKFLERFATDNFVTTVRAYMKKADEDKLGGMVYMLQKVLQLFGAEMMLALCKDLDKSENVSTESAALLTALLKVEEEQWDDMLVEKLYSSSATLDAAAFTDLINSEVGAILFQLPTGSALQQVCAEYASEILDRIQKLDPNKEEQSEEA